MKEKMKERIEFSFTQEEFVKEIIGNVLDREGPQKMIQSDPIMSLMFVMIGKEVWDEMCEYKRRLEAAKILGESEEER